MRHKESNQVEAFKSHKNPTGSAITGMNFIKKALKGTTMQHQNLLLS